MPSWARLRRTRSGTICRIPVAEAVVAVALKEPALSPRELAVSFVDQQRYFISESPVYRLLTSHDLITSPSAR